MYTNRGKNRFLHILIALLCILLVCSAGAFAVEDVPVIGTAVSEPQKAELIGTVLQEASTAEAPEEAFVLVRAEGVLQEGEFPGAERVDDGIALQTSDDAYAEAIEVLIAGLRARRKEIDIGRYKIPKSEIGSVYRDMLNNNPQLFYVNSGFRYTLNGLNNIVYSITPDYDTLYSETDILVFEQTCAGIVSCVDPSWSDVQKLLFLHDYLVTHCEYDNTLSKFNAYNALVDRSAVCAGYTLAFVHLAHCVGLDADYISSRSINHAWNAVTLDGERFYIDCTWDDPTTTTGDLYEGYCGHKNFLRSRDGMRQTGHDSTDWTCGTGDCYSKESSARYDEAWWIDKITAIAQIGSTCAYGDNRSVKEVYLRDWESGTETAVSLPTRARWQVWDEPYSYWSTRYYSFAAMDGAFYFTTPESIWRLNPAGELTQRYQLTAEEKTMGYIYGIVEEGGELYYSIGTKPSGTSFTRKQLFALSGDLNDDGKRDVKDITLLRRVLAGGYAMNIAEKKTDVTRDEKVNAKDITILRRCIAGGYGVEID